MSLRDVSGALLIDKPTGITSAGIVGQLKRKFRFNKIGHAGTLDPNATGLLIILLGKATRLQDVFLGAEKGYEGEFRLGVATDTDDITGHEIQRDDALAFWNGKDPEQILRALERSFLGTIEQLPPAYSALKVDGERSYDLARQGRAPELKPRTVTIDKMELRFVSRERLHYSIRCSKGTYIRSIARDLGHMLGSVACVETLRRVESSPFSVADAVAVEGLSDETQLEQSLRPLERLVQHLPGVRVDEACAAELRRGVQSSLGRIGLAAPERCGMMAIIWGPEDKVVAVAETSVAETEEAVAPVWKLRCVL